MANRYINPFPQYINISGSPINGGFLKFFDAGTADPKPVYSDADLSDEIGVVVRLDASGRIPDIYLDGAYGVVLTDSDGNEIDSADPIGIDTDIVNFDLWLNTNTYNIPDIVLGSDNLYYQSVEDTNLGNNPTSQPSLFWEQINFLPTWNSVQIYSQGQLVIDNLDSRVYQAQQGNNEDIQPSQNTAGDFWQILLQNGDDIDAAGLTISKTGGNAASITFQSDDLTSWLWDFDASENMSLDRYIAGTLQDTVLSIDNATGAITTVGDVSGTGNLTFNDSDVTFNQDTSTLDFQMFLSSDAAKQATIEFQDATVRRWELGQNAANFFNLVGYDASGTGTQSIFAVDYDTLLTVFAAGNIGFNNTDQGFEVINTSGGALNFNFTALSVGDEDTAFDFFDNTTTTGAKLFNIYQGDGTSTITCQIDAETGSIYPAFDRAGEADPGVKLNKITLSTDAPSGGEDGDLWLRY